MKCKENRFVFVILRLLVAAGPTFALPLSLGLRYLGPAFLFLALVFFPPSTTTFRPLVGKPFLLLR